LSTHTKCIFYANIHQDKDGWVEEFPKNYFVKKKLQEAIEQANEVNWRFIAKKRGSANQKKPKPKNVCIKN